MRNSVISLLSSAILISSLLGISGQTVHAQGLSFPAEMNKGFSPLSIVAGGTARLSVTIFNPNAFPLTDATWTDNLIGVQPGLSIANPVNLTNTCGGTVTAIPGGSSLSLSGGTVPAQVETTPGSCTVSIDVTSTVSGNLINTIPAGTLDSIGNGDSITNTSPASATLHVGGALPPTVRKSFSSSTIWVGQTVQLSIVIRNNDLNTALTQASLTDNLPTGVFLASPVSPTLTGCGDSASLSAVTGETSVTLSNATIAPNSTCTIRVNVSSNTQGAYTNIIPANALQTQQGLTNISQTSTRLNVQAVGVTKQFMSTSFQAGETNTLIITLQNPTASEYTGVNVSDTLPGTALTVVDGSATTTCGGTVSTTPPRTVSLTGGTIPAGNVTSPGTCTITVQVNAPADTPSAVYTNTIPAGALVTGEGVTNLRPATTTVTVTGVDVRGIKTFSPSSIAAGENSRLRIDIFAPSDTNLTNFSITDNLPAGVTVSNSMAPVITGCGAAPPLVFTAPTGATSISLSNGLILSGQSCRIDVYVTSSTPGMYTNTIPPTSITNDQNRAPTGNLIANLTVANAINLSFGVVKGFNPLTVFGGAASTLSVQLINPSNVALMGITFTDHMPSGMIISTPPSPSVGTCGGKLTANPGDNSFSFSSGSLAAATSCTLTLRVTMIVNGNLTNVIPANTVTSSNGASNPDPAEASLTNLPGASISKYFSTNTISAGDYSLLTITIQNTGNVALSGMGLKDTLPLGLTIADAPAPMNHCGGTLTASKGTRLIQLTDGSLTASASCTFVVSVTGKSPGSYQNTIPAGTLSSDQGVTNHDFTTDILVVKAKVSGGRGKGKPTPTPTSSGFLIPVTGFAPDTVTKLDARSRLAYDATGLTIEIPVIQVSTSIVGVQIKNGSWDVSWLQDQVGWLNGTAFPTWKGNSLLTGHVTNADGKPGVFSKLKSVGVGEYIFVYNSGYRYTYQIVSNQFVQPDDSTVLIHEEKSYLTLVTCDTYDEKTGSYLRRVAVRAMLVDVRAIN